MQDAPDIDQLLESVAAFLREQVAVQSTGQLAFHARVAANTLDIVRREIRLGPDAQARELQRLLALPGADATTDLFEANRRLCERIAAGATDARTPGLLEHLMQTARDKLAIDQPGYGDDDKDRNVMK